MAIEKVNNNLYQKGISENYKNMVNENAAQKKTKPMLQPKKESVLAKGFKIDAKA
jgi:hypothetical protein